MTTHWKLGLVGVAGFCLAILAYFWLSLNASSVAQLDFQQAAEAQRLTAERELTLGLARLEGLAGLCGSLPEVTPERFQEITALALTPVFSSWMWIPQVGTGDLEAFLAEARAHVSPDYQVRSLPSGAAAADVLFPVLLVSPANASATVGGVDLGSSQEMAAKLGQAARDKATQLVPPLPPETEGFLAVAPVFRPSGVLEGFLAARVEAGALLTRIRKLDYSGQRMALSLTGPEGQRLASDNQAPVDPSLQPVNLPFEVGGLRFVLTVRPSPDFLARAPQPWQGPALILLFTFLILGLMGQGATQQLAEATRDRSQLEAALKKSEARLLELFETSQAMLYTHDTEGVLSQVNPAAARSLGYQPAEMVGKNLRDFVLPTERQEFADYLETLRSRPSAQGNLNLYARNGSTRIWLFHASVYEGEVRANAQDVTDTKRAERELERVSRQMEMILNSAGEGIFGVNLAGECSFLNPAAAKLTGYTAEYLQTTEHPVHDLLMSKKADGSPYAWEDSALYATLHDQKVRRQTGEVMWRRDGSSFPVEYVCTALLEADRVRGAVVTFQDVTERLAIEQMKDEFVSVVSHELRTPLTSIRGSLGLLASGILQKAPEKAEAMLKIAVTNTDRLVRLINDILDIERLRSGRVSLEKRQCDLGDLMSQAGEVMEAMATQHQVKLDVQPYHATVHADPDRILQVLTNLLSNAIKFSNPQGTVWLLALLSDGMVKVQVKDQGRGIPEDKLEAVFERFQQVESGDSRKKGGTGLGLTICQTIIEQHGGRIWVESVMGQGSTFQFTLPLVAAPVPPAGEASPNGTPGEAKKEQPSSAPTH